MPRRVILPPHLSGTSFTVAQGAALGLGRGRMSSRDVAAPYYGIRTVGDVTRARAYVPRLRPGDRFSHTTAAELWGAPLPRDLEGLVHVTAGAGLDRPRTAGVIGHTGDRKPVGRAGIPVSDPVTMFLELATILTLDRLVAVGDHLVLDPRVLDPHDVRPHVPLADLLTATRAATGRGVRRARAAAALVRAGVESPRETQLRLLLLGAGVPEPVCGYEVWQGRRRIGWFDLAWPADGVLVEYDGDQHRTSTVQYEKDIRRFDAASAAGWEVVRVRSRGLQHPHETVSRVGDAFARAARRRGRSQGHE